MKIRKRLIALIMVAIMVFGLLPMNVQAANSYEREKKISINGKTYILWTYYRAYDDKEASFLLEKTAKRQQLVAEYSGDSRMEYEFCYGKKIFFTLGHRPETTERTYSYTIGATEFQLEKSPLQLADHRGRYAIGYTYRATDIGANKLCLYNLSNRKQTFLGRGYDIRFIGGKVYYVKVSKDDKTAQIIRCNPDGSGKKILKTVKDKRGLYGFQFKNKHCVICYPGARDGLYVSF